MFQIYLCFSRYLSLRYLLYFHRWKPIINLKVCSQFVRSLSLFPPFIVLLSELESKIDFCNVASYFTNPSPCSTLHEQLDLLFLKPIIVGMKSFMKIAIHFLNFLVRKTYLDNWNAWERCGVLLMLIMGSYYFGGKCKVHKGANIIKVYLCKSFICYWFLRSKDNIVFGVDCLKT